MVPAQGRGIETANFRTVKDSTSVDIGGAAKLKGVPLDSGLATPKLEAPDPFEEFNSVTLHHDGEDHQHDQVHREMQQKKQKENDREREREREKEMERLKEGHPSEA